MTQETEIKLTQEQKNAMLRYILTPGSVKGFIEGLDGEDLKLFPDFDQNCSAYWRALENFIQDERDKLQAQA